MKYRDGRKGGAQRTFRRFFHKLKLNKFRVITAAIAILAMVIGFSSIFVPHINAVSKFETDYVPETDFVNVQVASVSVGLSSEQEISIVKNTDNATVEDDDAALNTDVSSDSDDIEDHDSVEDKSEPESESLYDEDNLEAVSVEETEQLTDDENQIFEDCAQYEEEPYVEEAYTLGSEAEYEDKAEAESGVTPESIDSSLAYSAEYTGATFCWLGEIYWNDWKWTWYSENVLPGGGLNIPGRHVDEQGFICDENNRICLASNTEDLPAGTVVPTPFGKDGCVYDSGCSVGTLDVYVSW